MNWTIFATLLVSVMALAASIGAFAVAVRSWRLSQSRQSSTLFVQLTELQSTVEALSQNLHRLRSRVNQWKYRDNSRASTEPTEAPAVDDAAEIRAQLNDRLARKGLP